MWPGQPDQSTELLEHVDYHYVENSLIIGKKNKVCQLTINHTINH